MNQGILSDLYHGNLAPLDKTIIKGSDYDKIQKKLDKLVENLTEILEKDQKSTLDELIETLRRLEAISSQEYFVDGFKLGAKILAAVYEREDGQGEFKST